MKWNKKNDTFTLKRQELADVLDFLDGLDLRRENDQPIGWKKFRKETYLPLNALMGKYTTEETIIIRNGKMVFDKKWDSRDDRMQDLTQKEIKKILNERMDGYKKKKARK